MQYSLYLLFLLLIFVFRLDAMLKSIVETDGDWVTIMTLQDSVVIDSDPDSSGSLPDVNQSYFPFKPIKQTPTDEKPCVTKLLQLHNLTELIRENYPEGFDAPLVKHVLALRVVNKIVFQKK